MAFESGGAELERSDFALQEIWAVHVMLGISQLLALPEEDGLAGVFRLGHHRVKRFDALGVVVGFEIKENKNQTFRANIVLDDGSGVIHCVRWLDSGDAAAGKRPSDVPLGSLLRVRGGMSMFRGRRQLSAFHTNVEHDPLAEPMRWLELERLWRDVYSKDPRPAIAALTDAAGAGARSGGDSKAVRAAIEALHCPPEADPEETEPQSAEARARRSFAYASLIDPAGPVYAVALRCAQRGALGKRARGEAGVGSGDDADAERRVHGDARRLVQNAVAGLRTDGRIELINEDADLYAPFSPGGHLLRAIRSHFALAAAADAADGGTITLARLHALLAAHEGGSFTVSKATLRTAIETLLEESFIYDVGADTYRVLL